MMLLKPKVRTLIEGMVKEGVPPVSAGMSLGVSANTMGRWLNCGMGFVDYAPKRPDKMDKSMECDKAVITEGEWYYHERECAMLARVVVATEGTMIAKLAKRMWKNSGRNPDMMKFMFKTYTHAHGLRTVEPSHQAKEIKPDPNNGLDNPDAVTIILPDNGRLIVKAAL